MHHQVLAACQAAVASLPCIANHQHDGVCDLVWRLQTLASCPANPKRPTCQHVATTSRVHSAQMVTDNWAWLQGDGTIVESPRVAARHVRVPRAGALDDSLCHSPAGSASPNRQAHGKAPISMLSMLVHGVHQAARTLPAHYVGALPGANAVAA